MKVFIRFLIFSVLLVLPSGYSFRRIDYRDAMSNNVCKSLKDNVLVYFIFVDSQETSPWTEFDIKTTIDSMEIAIQWLEMIARQNGIPLNIIQDYYIGEEYTTIKRALPMGNVINSVYEPSFSKGLKELNEWADNVAKRAGSSFEMNGKDGISEIKNPRNKERLVAYLRA